MLVCKSLGNQEVGKYCKKKISFERMKHKIVIIGESHGRDCALRVKYDMDNTFEVQGIIKPRDGLMTVIKTSKEEVKNLTKKNVVVVWRGTKDVRKRMRLQMA
jgi:hypothetical protein